MRDETVDLKRLMAKLWDETQTLTPAESELVFRALAFDGPQQPPIPPQEPTP